MRFSKSTEDLIADFRGLPRVVTVASMREPVGVKNLVAILKEKHRLERPSAERTLVEYWNEIFGGLAARCQPRAIRSGVLSVAVANQTLRTELRFRKAGYLQRIRRLPNCGEVRDIRFTGG